MDILAARVIGISKSAANGYTSDWTGPTAQCLSRRRARYKPCYRLVRWNGRRTGWLASNAQFDHEGIRAGAGEHRERTTIRRREAGAGNGKQSPVGADRSSGKAATGKRANRRLRRQANYADSIQRSDSQANQSRPGFTPHRTRTSPCFIATAACGKGNAPEVLALRSFRDQVLSNSRCGRINRHLRVYLAAARADASRDRILLRC